MTGDEQELAEFRSQSRYLTRENVRLFDVLIRKTQEMRELEEANAELCVECDATDALLGAAMDKVLETRPQ